MIGQALCHCDRSCHGRLERCRHAVLRHTEGASEATRCIKTFSRASLRTRLRLMRRTWHTNDPGSQDRDYALSTARFEFDRNEQFRLALDPESAK